MTNLIENLSFQDWLTLSSAPALFSKQYHHNSIILSPGQKCDFFKGYWHSSPVFAALTACESQTPEFVADMWGKVENVHILALSVRYLVLKRKEKHFQLSLIDNGDVWMLSQYLKTLRIDMRSSTKASSARPAWNQVLLFGAWIFGYFGI